MRIATYNLWNSPIRWLERLEAAGEGLTRLDADIVALQEVAVEAEKLDERDVARYLAVRCGYGHVATHQYPDDAKECLAFLSKVPLHDIEAGSETGLLALKNCGLRTQVSIGGAKVAITNVHLDYANIATREAQIAHVLEWVEARSVEGCYEVLGGDFNCPPDSSVYRFLAGQQTLMGKGIRHWHDLARYSAERAGGTAAPTLDFWSNPRWRESPTLEIPTRCDWILLEDVFGRGIPYPSVLDAGIFGTEPTPRARVVPSDHYGVYADLDFGAQA